jgi:hypothetical protein
MRYLALPKSSAAENARPLIQIRPRGREAQGVGLTLYTWHRLQLRASTVFYTNHYS